MTFSDEVYLQCVRVNHRLRVRIISSNYLQHLNCQFPAAIRTEGQIYGVRAQDIKLITRKHRDFYFITKKNIRMIEENDGLSDVKLYTAEHDDTCCICLDHKKYYVYLTCGHFYVCRFCHRQISRCPICRSVILKAIPFHELRT